MPAGAYAFFFLSRLSADFPGQNSLHVLPLEGDSPFCNLRRPRSLFFISADLHSFSYFFPCPATRQQNPISSWNFRGLSYLGSGLLDDACFCFLWFCAAVCVLLGHFQAQGLGSCTRLFVLVPYSICIPATQRRCVVTSQGVTKVNS